jgi:hypothetical protein
MSVCTKYSEILLYIRKQTLNGSVLESLTVHIRWILLSMRKNTVVLQYDSHNVDLRPINFTLLIPRTTIQSIYFISQESD